jgi:hypothetical protein
MKKLFSYWLFFFFFPVRSPYETAKLQTRFLPFFADFAKDEFPCVCAFLAKIRFLRVHRRFSFSTGSRLCASAAFLSSRELPFRTF